MKRLQGTVPFTTGALLAALVAAGPLAADDTEIFFGQTGLGDSANPNVLFILDTSGSMGFSDEGQTGTRMQRLQEAMHDILDSSTDVNIGLMGLNGSYGGGPVLYPVTPVEKLVCAGGACDAMNLVASIEHVDDDTEELVADGSSRPDGSWLTMGTTNEGAQRVGLRFRDLNIPQGATITAATLELDAVRRFAALPPDHPAWARLDAIEARHHALLERIDTRFHDFSRLDERFHDCLGQIVRNRFATEFRKVISLIFHYHYQWDKTNERARNEAAIGEHLAIVAALRTGDAAAAEAAAAAHLATSKQTLLSSLRDHRLA